MNAFRRFFRWYGLLSKRLFRRPAYLAVLLMVPLFSLALLFFSHRDSGVVTVALCCENPLDPAASAAAERLLDRGSALRCITFADPEEARAAVEHAQADAAWIFSADASGEMARFVRRGRASVVTVVEREDNVFLMLAREKLYAAIYPELSFEIFSDFINEAAGEPVPSGVLRTYYASGTTTERMLRFATADGTVIETPDHYLVSPLRGILALVLMLSGFASGMYCYREERGGSFVWLSPGRRLMLPVLCHLTAILPTAAAAMIAMALSGLLTAFWRELLLMLLLSVTAALFCELLRCFAPQEEHFGALIPVLIIAMLLLCPIFADLNMLRPLRLLFPPFYYLSAVHNSAYLGAMAVYLAVLIPAVWLVRLVRRNVRGG